MLTTHKVLPGTANLFAQLVRQTEAHVILAVILMLSPFATYRRTIEKKRRLPLSTFVRNCSHNVVDSCT